MRRALLLGVGVLAFLLAACQDTNQPLDPGTAVTSSVAEPAFSLQATGDRVMPGQVLARFKEGADPANVGRAYGLSLERMGYGNRYAVLKGAVGNERALAARLKGDAQVISAEPNWLRQPHEDDSPLGIDARLWAFYNPGGLTVTITRGRNKGAVVTSFISVADADEDNIFGYATGGAPVAIASIDTGVDDLHTEFGQATIVPVWDYYDHDDDPSDTEGHGTHTTGTMVGDQVGVAGVAGAASNVTVYVFRVCGALGCPTSAIIDAIRHATDLGVVAMNLSLGGGILSTEEEAAIQYATDEGALVIASAGNDGTGTVSCPACDDNAISVAASNWMDQLTYYSNYGPGLDITAPGGQLYSNTTEDGGIYSSVPGGYAYYQGTSMAAPQVTGAAAVVASVTDLRGAALRSRLEDTADDLGASGWDPTFGNGRLNVYRAVTNTTLGDGGGDPPPTDELTAVFSKSCVSARCTFDGTASTGASFWEWGFGDGTNGTGSVAVHEYADDGTFTVILTTFNEARSEFATSAPQTVTCKWAGPNLKCK